MKANWKKWALVGLAVAGISFAAATQVIPTYDSWLFKNTTEFVQTVTIDNPPFGNALTVNGPAAFNSTVAMTGQPAIDGGLYTNGLNVVGPVVQGSGAVSFDAGVYAQSLQVAGAISLTSGALTGPITQTAGAVSFDAGVFVNSIAIGVGGTRLTNFCSVAIDYDMPALVTVGAGRSCARSNNGTCALAAFGDTCAFGVDQVVTPGVGSAVMIQPSVTAANTVVVDMCYVGAFDAGTFNQPDSSYFVKCFR